MHEAQAVVVEQRLRSYEFIHATFGEHLAARLIEQALHRLVTSADSGQGPLDDGELFALLSFVPLTDRAQLVQNLREMLAAWTDSEGRRKVPGLLAQLSAEAAWGPTQRTDLGHTPTRLTRTYQEAVYGVNLLLTAVLAAGEVHISEFLGTDDVIDTWRRHSGLWQSQLSSNSWELLTSALIPHRIWRPGPNGDDQRPELLIDLNDESILAHGLNWPIRYLVSPSPERSSRSVHHPDGSIENVMRRVGFVGDHDADLLRHIADPVLDRLPSAIHLYHVNAGGQVQSAARSLVALLITGPNLYGELPALYLTCRDAVARLPFDEERAGLEAICRRLVSDVPALSDSALVSVLRSILDHNPVKTPVIRQALRECVRRALGRSEELDALLNELCFAFDLHQWSSSEPDDLLRLTWAGTSSTTWNWSKPTYGSDEKPDFNEILASHDPRETAARHPSSAIDVLRLAADLGLDDWLASHAEACLQALPRSAFGLLRPSDLTYLRKALPPGAYAAEFAEVERIWHDRSGPARDGTTGD